MAITFDTSAAPALYIVLDAAQLTYTASEIYTEWKLWALAENAEWPAAWRPVGGDDAGAGETTPAFFFIRNDNGWRIRKPDGNGEYVIDGNVLAENTSLPTTEEPVGAFTPTLRINLRNVTGINVSAFWEAVLADFPDTSTAGNIVNSILTLSKQLEATTAIINENNGPCAQ